MSQPSQSGSGTRHSSNPTTPPPKSSSTKPSGSRGSGPQQSVSSTLVPSRDLNRYKPNRSLQTQETPDCLAPKRRGEIFPPSETDPVQARKTADVLKLVEERSKARRDAQIQFGASRWDAYIRPEKPSEDQE